MQQPPRSIFVSNKTNIRYLSGFAGTAGFLVTSGDKGFLFTDARYHLVAAKVLPKNFKIVDITPGIEAVFKNFLKKQHVRQLGFEGSDVSHTFYKRLKKMAAGLKLIDCGTHYVEKRMVKTEKEIVLIEKAQKITDEIFSELRGWLQPGVSELQIAWQIEVLARELSADDISFTPIIGINEHSAAPHHHNTERKLKRGDMILIDMGVMYKGYCSDMTRVLFTKPPTALQIKVYELVQKAQRNAELFIKAGVTGQAADSIARDVIKKAGYGEMFGHSLGHGVGLDIHELPNLSQKYSGTLPENSVVTIEPGVYLPGKFGVRLEDIVVVGKKGVRNLTKSPKDIQECIIKLK